MNPKWALVVRRSSGNSNQRPQIPDVLRHVGSGWSQILLDLHQQLVQEAPDYGVNQVKEKFGELRVCLDCWGESIDKFVRTAEQRSRETCEICGAAGTLRTDRSWYLTMCDNHAGTRPFGVAPEVSKGSTQQ